MKGRHTTKTRQRTRKTKRTRIVMSKIGFGFREEKDSSRLSYNF